MTITRQKLSSIKGITFVEMLVALAVFMLIMSMLSGILHQFLKTSDKIASTMSAYDGVRIFATQITSELGSTMVRKEKDRWLNLKIEDDQDRTAIFFTAPDENLRSVRALNFISHYVYYWDKERNAVYRGVYNTRTDPEILQSTAADAANQDREANQSRLTRMTLAYRSGSPYGWTRSSEMGELMDQEPQYAILRHVFGFNVRSFTKPKSEASSSRSSDEGEVRWENPESLPLFVEIELLVSDNRAAAGFRREISQNGSLSEESQKRLRRFSITVPMRSQGVNSNLIY